MALFRTKACSMARLWRRGSQSCRMLPCTRSPAVLLRLCSRLSGRDCECMGEGNNEVCEGSEVSSERGEARSMCEGGCVKKGEVKV